MPEDIYSIYVTSEGPFLRLNICGKASELQLYRVQFDIMGRVFTPFPIDEATER